MKTVQVCVTEEHWERATELRRKGRSISRCCPNALAIRESLGCVVVVGLDGWRLLTSSFRNRLPPKAKRVGKAFDANETIPLPVCFDLEVPE